MELTIWFGIFFLIAALMVALFAGDKFANAYLKELGGEDKFYYRRWKYCFVLHIILVGIAFFFWSSVVGPILLLIAMILRPLLTSTYCRRKN